MPVVWLDLPSELWEQIYLKLDDLRDLVRFRVVCSLFRFIALQKQPSHALLMYQAGDKSGIFRFFSLSNCKLYWMHLPELYGKRICGFFNGWVLTIDSDASVCLLNPLSRAHISLPSLDNYFLWIYNATISVTPSTCNDFTVMITYKFMHRQVYCKPGDKKWTPILLLLDTIDDVIYYKMKFYAINRKGYLRALVFLILKLQRLKEIIPSSRTNEINEISSKYLVESLGGDLLMVERFPNHSNCRTLKFKVFKLDENMMKWIRVENLGDEALFVDHNRAVCLSASEHLECKANCIYFVDPYRFGMELYACGKVFSLEDGTIKQLYDIAYDYDYIWTTLNLS